MSNTIGTLLKLTTFGESHGLYVGGVLDGFPSNIEIDLDFIQLQIDRRKPNQSTITTKRNETDKIQIISGLFDNKTLGTPIAFLFKNQDQNSQDYDNLENIFRPSHADFTYQQKYAIRDYRGGGRASARETVCRVAAGAFANYFLKKIGIEIYTFVSRVGDITVNSKPTIEQLKTTYNFASRCPFESKDKQIIELIKNIQKEKDSIGGEITCIIKNVPAGLGEPVFDKFQAELAKAIMSINACKGFEIGNGFEAAKLKGSENNDEFYQKNGNIFKKTNNSGGILGGITDGFDVFFKAAFKPPASISKIQNTIDINKKNTQMAITGRHDPCIVPRANSVVEAMTALVTADFVLQHNAYKNLF